MKFRLINLFVLVACLMMTVKGIASDLNLNRQQVLLAPEWCHLTRLKKGGTKQQGNLIGGRLRYDRLKRYGWYYGGELIYAEGVLKGHSGMGNKLRSRFTEERVEGRFGYTFQQKDQWQVACSPFIGFGYMIEKNHFVRSSVLPIHFKTRYTYFTTGFLSWIHLAKRLELGVNFAIKIPFEPKCKVTHDPDEETVTQKIKEQWHYELQLPIAFRLTEDGVFSLAMIPFFEFRNYGNHVNFPFDYLKTTLRLWGVMGGLQYRW